MEKAGSLFKNEGLQEKGQAKRAAAGNDEYSSGTTGSDSYGSNTGNSGYGSGNTGGDNYGSSGDSNQNNY